MKLIAAYSTLFFTMAGLALAQQPNEYTDKLCIELRAEVGRFLSNYDEKDHDFYLYDSKSPLMVAIDSTMAELEDGSILRIRSVLSETLMRACIYPNESIEQIHKEHGLPESPTFGQVLDTILMIWALDRSAPRWGLAKNPELDVSELKIKEFVLNHPRPNADKAGWETDDPVHFTLMKLFSTYDLSTPNAAERAERVIYLFFQDMDTEEGNLELTFKEYFDRLAIEQGIDTPVTIR